MPFLFLPALLFGSEFFRRQCSLHGGARQDTGPTIAAEPPRNRVIARIRALLQALRGRLPATGELDELGKLLASVALAPPDAGLAALHLRKAKRFLHSEEVGSAMYELRLLLACLTGI